MPNLSDSVLDIRGFQLFRNDFISVRPKHGVCIYVKSHLKVGKITKPIPNVLAIHLTDYDLYVLTVYRPPSNSPDENTRLAEFLENFVTGKEVIILGDFNLPTIKWGDNSPDSQACRADKLFFESFSTLGLNQFVNEPTFIPSGNILDLALSTELDRIVDVRTFPPFPNCGHVVVCVDYLFQGHHHSGPGTNAKNTLRNWSKGKYSELTASLKLIDWNLEFVSGCKFSI